MPRAQKCTKLRLERRLPRGVEVLERDGPVLSGSIVNHGTIAMTSSVRLASLVALGVCLGACSQGGAGRNRTQGGTTGSPEASVRAKSVTVSVAPDGTVDASATVTGLAETGASVDLQVSEDGGSSWQNTRAQSITVAPGQPERQVTWRLKLADEIATVPQDDLALRVVPSPARKGFHGEAARSKLFSLGSGSAPRITLLEPANRVLGRDAEIHLALVDEQEDHVEVTGSVILATGRTLPATLATGASTIPSSRPERPRPAVLVWNAGNDLPDQGRRRVQIEVAAADASGETRARTPWFEVVTLRPEVSLLSVEGIEESMNGSKPYTTVDGEEVPFHLEAIARGLRVTIACSTLAGGVPLDPATLVIAAAGVRLPGSVELGSPVPLPGAEGRSVLHWPAALADWTGDVTLTAAVSDELGNRSLERALTFTLVSPGAHRKRSDGQEAWFLDFSRDRYTIRSRLGERQGVWVEAEEAGNGIPDYEEDLAILGLARPDAAPGTQEADLGHLVVEWTKEAIRAHVLRLYGRDPEGRSAEEAPNLAVYLEKPGVPCSRMAIGGDDPVPGFTLGRAAYDHRNSRQDDNTGRSLGIFTTNLIEFHVNAVNDFRQRFDALIPGRGAPVGDLPEDRVALAADLDPSLPGVDPAVIRRRNSIVRAVDGWARMVALITAHEMGHSLGLVANGPPPRGLFGGELGAEFSGPLTSPYHLDTYDNDIMAASLSFGEALLEGEAGPRFTALEWAYLLGKVVLE